MSNPVFKDIQKDVWTLLQAGVSRGIINVIDHTSEYFYTYRKTGEDAPANNIETDVRIKGLTLEIKSSELIDVYLLTKTKPGKVRFDECFSEISKVELSQKDADGNDSWRVGSEKNGLQVRLFDKQTNSEHAISPSGALETGELIRLIGGNFEGSILPAVLWITNLINAGTVTIVDGELRLMTNGEADGEAVVQSVNRAEFVTATFNKAHLAFGVDDITADDVQYEFGLFDPVSPTFSGDGVFWRIEAGDFELVRLSGGVEVETVLEVNFNGFNTIVKDNDIHVYELIYNAGRIDFYQDRKIIHRMFSLTSVAYETVHLTLGARVKNINGNSTVRTLRTRGFSCSRIGVASAQSDSITINSSGSTLLKNSPGQLDSVVIVDTGVAGASLELYDADDGAGTPFHTIDLTDALIDLTFNRRLNFGLFVIATGSAFEVAVNWK